MHTKPNMNMNMNKPEEVQKPPQSTLKEEFGRRRRAIQRRREPTPRVLWSESDSDSVDTFTAISQRIAERNKLRKGSQRNRIDLYCCSQSESDDDESIRQIIRRNILDRQITGLPLNNKTNRGNRKSETIS